jgi:hypothetical protein
MPSRKILYSILRAFIDQPNTLLIRPICECCGHIELSRYNAIYRSSRDEHDPIEEEFKCHIIIPTASLGLVDEEGVDPGVPLGAATG